MAPELIINTVGVAAGVCSMVSFAPQIGKILKTKSAEGVSLKMFSVTVTAFVLWTVYGVLRPHGPSLCPIWSALECRSPSSCFA
jgi:MtN3 and saliva related transmembrane protein